MITQEVKKDRISLFAFLIDKINQYFFNYYIIVTFDLEIEISDI
jgi:hypothetical protein